jgi:apolipoprotein N-acyltransferase
MHERMDRHPSWWLVLGAALLAASQMRFGLGVLAWLAPVPWLRYLRITRGARSRALLAGVAFLAWSVATLGIVTAPVPAIFALAFALPITVAFVGPLLAWPTLRARLGEGAASLGLAALAVTGEWALHGLLPFGTWGAAANTQLDQLALLQLASITGLHGVSALVWLVAAVLERGLAGERATLRPAAALVAAALVAIVAAGQARLSLAAASGHATRLVAAVGTDGTVGATPALPGRDELAAVERGLVERTERAALAGAELVVWTEAATMVHPEDEPAWQARLRALAARLRIDLVAAYVVPVSLEPLRYENKYLMVRSDGSIHHEYWKHHPVPGEPALPGRDPMPVVADEGRGAMGGGICYDYDFPRLALANARAGVDLVALPSSDWRGIDPIHTHMAAVRAIEGGHSIVRSARFGLSAGVDPWGRLRGLESHFDGEGRVLLVRLPVHGVGTAYAVLGDWFPLVCGLGGLGLCGLALRHRP